MKLKEVPVVVVDKTRGPDLPDGTPYKMIKDNGATMIIQVASDYLDITEQANTRTLQDKLTAALETNRTYLQSNPSNSEALAQIDVLTRQVNALARLVVAALDATDDT